MDGEELTRAAAQEVDQAILGLLLALLGKFRSIEQSNQFNADVPNG